MDIGQVKTLLSLVLFDQKHEVFKHGVQNAINKIIKQYHCYPLFLSFLGETPNSFLKVRLNQDGSLNPTS